MPPQSLVLTRGRADDNGAHLARAPVSVPAFSPRLAFVDVETTGSSPARERVTEIGLVRIDIDGDSVRTDEWSSLVNPGMPIPPEIEWLTGISNDMVRRAPTFDAVAQDLIDRLDGAVFIAHNARFDYGFLRAEFARAGLTFHAKTLCTVRLSRALYPDRAPHTLDALIDRFDLHGEQRHRALGDARILWNLVQTWYRRLPADEIEDAVHCLLRHPALPPNLPPGTIESLPHAAGVYLFYGLNEHPIYIGKSVNLRARVTRHFNSEHRAPRDLRLSQEIHRLEWEETAGEFGALLRESELVKTRLPAHNVALRRRENQVVIALDANERPVFSRALELNLDALGTSYGPFSSRSAARRWLADLASANALCLKTLGLEGRRSARDDGAPCFNRQLQRCRGACVGEENGQDHGARLRALIDPWRLPPWPYQGAIALVERNRERFREDWHVFDRWCCLGTYASFDAALAAAREAPRNFEADAARLAIRALSSDPPWPLEPVPLHDGAVQRVPNGGSAAGGITTSG